MRGGPFGFVSAPRRPASLASRGVSFLCGRGGGGGGGGRAVRGGAWRCIKAEGLPGALAAARGPVSVALLRGAPLGPGTFQRAGGGGGGVREGGMAAETSALGDSGGVDCRSWSR